jgi:ABC-type branched-subunit amino acid transport system substrate-binding protein
VGACLNGVLLVVLTSCSAFFDFDSQCENDGDCDGDRCFQGQCLTGPLPCASHFECDQNADLTGTELCIQGGCQQVIFDHPSGGGCSEMFGRLTDDPDNTLVVPILVSLAGGGSGFGPLTAANGFRMAARFANDSRGLGQRSVVMLICNDVSQFEAAEEVTRTVIERTGALSLLGPTGDNGLNGVLNVLVPNEVMLFTASPSLVVTNLVDNDLAFRTVPSDQLSLTGFEALPARLPDARIALMYRTDIITRRVLGEATAQALSDRLVASASYEGDAESYRAAATAIVEASGPEPVDLLIIVGQDEQGEVVNAYRDALPNGFENALPRIFTDTLGALSVASIIETNPDLTPFDIEAVLGAVVATDGFTSLYDANFNTDANLQLAGLFYDAAMLTLLAHAAAPDAKTGTELVRALRERVTAPNGMPIAGSDGVSAFGNAAAVLARGESIQYVQAAGGQPTRFDDKGDVPYPIISGTFLDPESTFFLPLRYLAGPVWLDACIGPGQPCTGGWTDAEDDPGQSCLASGIEGLGFCAPNCAPMGEASCPVDEMSCQPTEGEAGLCRVEGF